LLFAGRSALQLQGHGVLLRFGRNRLTIAHPDAFRANVPRVTISKFQSFHPDVSAPVTCAAQAGEWPEAPPPS